MNENDPNVPPIPPLAAPSAPAYPPPIAPRPHRGTLILVLGILGLVCTCFPAGIVAWVLGQSDLAAMRRGEIDPTGRSLTEAGRICGIISVGLAVIGLLFYVGLFVVGMMSQAFR